MNEQMETKANEPAFALGWLFAPLAVLLAFATTKVVGIDYDLSLNNMMPMLVVAAASMLAIVPRMVQTSRPDLPSSSISLVVLLVAFIGAEGLYNFAEVDAVAALMFALVLTIGSMLDRSGRHEWNSALTFSAVGFWLAIAAASSAMGDLPTTFERESGQLVSTLNLERQATLYVFFAYWTMATAAGLLAGVMSRGVLHPAGHDGWFSFMGYHDGFNRKALPLMVALGVWVLAFAGSLWHFNSVGVVDQLGITDEAGYHGYYGYWSAFFTGVIALMIAGMVAERWFTRAMLTGSMWGLYLVSSWFESGIWYAEELDGSWGALIWLGITFFIGVAIYTIANHEKYGGWANRGEHEPSQARLFMRSHGAGMMVALAFIIGLTVRIQWYAVPSMNAFGTGQWDMTGGSDPWYMKRVVDYILAQNAHLVYDADRFYPIGGINPRPPLFSWSMAVGAMLLKPFIANPDDAVWFSMLGLPAVYGALTVFPIASMAKDHFGKGAGVLAAWLVAFMPAHVTHSTWALADHDSFVMLFICVGFMYWLRAVKYAGSARITRTTTAHPLSFARAFRDVAVHRQAAMANAILAGVAFGIVALGWKGFVVGPSILFLAYALQVALNMFRRRDSTTLSVMFLTMLAVIFVMVLPFYGHPQFDLIFDGTGLQPFLFIFIFTLAIAFVTTGFRDKPWLLVLGTLAGLATVFFVILYVLKALEFSNAWDVLFTGSGYFTKTKIFGTVAEANAPNRAQLFASFGPITFLLALIMGGGLLWKGMRHRQATSLVFGVWVFAATFMAWNAARFMFNATPVMAILGAAGILAFWQWAGWSGLVRSWKKFGIRTPADRITAARKAVWRTPQFSAVFLVMIMIFGQQATYGLDSAIPSTSNQEAEIDERIHNIVPDILRFDGLGFSILDSSTYDGREYLGSFGSSFNDNGWNSAYSWLADQDTNMTYSDRPAFVSWWDYGFQAMNNGKHPSVSDNFQSGIPATGNMLLARSQEDLTAMFIWQLAEGDRTYATGDGESYTFTPQFERTVEGYLSEDQWNDFEHMQTNFGEGMLEFIEERSFQVIKTNRNVVMAEGYPSTAGIFDTDSNTYRIYKDGVQIPCTDELSTSCLGDDWSSQDQADITFGNNIRTGEDTIESKTHVIFGDYWYTSDLVDEYLSVSTSIHRKNARLAMATQLLTDAFDANPDATIHDLYADLINLEDLYTVQDFNGLPGETIERDHEIRYFAIDDRLYPRAGRYTADANYNRGQPMGIFGAPTILSGQDVSTYMDEVYETTRGEFQDEMSREEVDEAMQKDFLNQQSGADIDPLMVNDVRVDHNAAFFDTMVARTYVGYGASTLGISTGSSNPQPAQHFGQSGSPGTILNQALPLPGAMMNNFVIANWYNEDANVSIQQTNTLVKILKYYPGAEMSGQVTMSDTGEGLPGVRLLIERDAFSGEGAEDLDEDTYWVPIGFVDADDDGEYTFIVPAGRIRVTAFAGDYDPTSTRDEIRDGSYADRLGDILTDTNENREINQITALLGNVANMTWLGETQVNVTGDQADRMTDMTESVDLAIQSSGVSGTVVWSGDESFAGDPISETTFILRNIWSMTDNYTVETTSGSFTSDESRILQGTGEATFVENGTFDSEGIAIARNFIGTFTRDIGNERTFFANGTWDGYGTIEATWTESNDIASCEFDNDSLPTMPANETFCLVDDTGDLPIYKLEGEVNATGSFTSEGTSILTRTYGDYDTGQGETIEGAGSFAGVGTFNGTGLFVGIGSFSGQMVEPGSFYKTGLLPGTYNMIAQLDNGKEVLLPDPVEIGIEATYDLNMNMPGGIFEDVLKDMHDEVLANKTIELIDVDLGEEYKVLIPTDENGSFSYGPIAKGQYYYRVDVDQDGWYDMNASALVDETVTNITILFNVPDTADLTLNLVSPVDPLTQEPLFDVTNRTITFDNTAGLLDPINVTSDESGEIYVELFYGEWEIRDDVNPEFVLFEQIVLDVGDDEVQREVTYAEAAWVNGTIRVHEFETIEQYQEWDETPVENRFESTVAATRQTVNLRAGTLEFSAITDDTNGDFSVRVPSGFDYHMTALSVEDVGYGQLLTVDAGENIDVGVLYLAPTVDVSGFIYLYDNSSRWDSTLPLWEAPVVTATNDDGLELQIDATDSGSFSFALPAGTWDITMEDELLNATSVADIDVNFSAVEALSPQELFVHPNAVELTMNIFLNSDEDGTFENGTKVTPGFYLRPMDENRDSLYFTSEDYSEDGIITVSLTPGGYDLLFNRTTADSENATDYDLVAEIFFDAIQVGLDEFDQAFEVPLRNTYLVNGTLTNVSGDGIANEFLLYNEAEEEWFNVGSDENGTFAAYVPAGEWLIIVAPFMQDNVTETLRQPLSVGATSDRLNLDLNTEESVHVTLQLKELLTESALSDMSVTAVSNDGYGNITFERTDDDGNSSEMMMPGSWSLYLNRTVGTKMWFMDTSSKPFTTDDADNNTLILDVNYAALEVEIGGKIYWDLDNNSLPSMNEGIPEMNVTLQGTNNSEYSTVVQSDEQGVWRAFVPIRDVYNVSVTKDGFETVYYETDNTTGYMVLDSPDSKDIEVSAGSVQVTGSVTDQIDAARLEGASIVLYPAVGIERDIIELTGTVVDDVLEWNAEIQPGEWIVIVTDTNPGPNGGGVAIGMLDASVANGGNISMVMALGGYVDLATSWNDIAQESHHAGSDDTEGAAMLQAPVDIEVTFGEMSWMMDVPASGTLTKLLPEGSVAFDSEFVTVQHDDALEMEYYGGQTANVNADSTISTTLNYNRRVNSDLVLEYNNASLVNATSVDIANPEVMARVSSTNESSYDVISFDIDVTYNGTEVMDIFSVSAEMGLAQDSGLWTVEVYNTSSEAYESSTDVSLGIGDNETSAVATATVSIRVTLPSVEDAWHLDDAHRVTLRMESELGEASQSSVKVIVPQNFGFSIGEATEVVGISPLVERSFSFEVTNDGNGQDTFSIELLESGVPADWSVTPMNTNLTLAKGETRTQQFSVFAPASFDGGEFDLTVYVIGSDEEQTEEIDVTVQYAQIKLNIDQGAIVTESSQIAGESGDVVIPVENLGLLDATSVIVYLTPDGEAERSVTISVPAESTVNAVFDGITQTQGNKRYDVRVEVAGEEANNVEEITPDGGEFDLSIEYNTATSADGDSIWLTLAIIALGLLVIYGGVRTARSRGGTKF